MGFFENELRKMFERTSPIKNARFVGRVCIGKLGETNTVKLEFVTLGTYQKYEGIKVSIVNRANGEIDSNTFRFADILGKNVRCGNVNSDLPHVWINPNGKTEWYAYKPTEADYSAVAHEINSYMEVFTGQEQLPKNRNVGTLYLLYSYNEWCEKSKASLLLITSDKETLYAAIAGEILTGSMDYIGETGGEGFRRYKADYLRGVDVIEELDYGFVKEMDDALLSKPETLPEYYKSANEFLAADFHFDAAEFDRAYNSVDEADPDSDEIKPQKDLLCDCCIRAIRSRGETIYVGNPVRDDDENACKWCGESGDLFSVMFEHTLSYDDAEESEMER